MKGSPASDTRRYAKAIPSLAAALALVGAPGCATPPPKPVSKFEIRNLSGQKNTQPDELLIEPQKMEFFRRIGTSLKLANIANRVWTDARDRRMSLVSYHTKSFRDHLALSVFTYGPGDGSVRCVDIYANMGGNLGRYILLRHFETDAEIIRVEFDAPVVNIVVDSVEPSGKRIRSWYGHLYTNKLELIDNVNDGQVELN